MDMDFNDLPPELRQIFAEQARQADLIDMQVTDQENRLNDFLSDLSLHQLAGLSLLCRYILRSPKQHAYYVSGKVDGIIFGKFGASICPTHGVDHSLEKLQEELQSEPVAEFESPQRYEYTEADALRMQEYRLTTTGDGRLVCRDCGLEYQSIFDRVLRKPDECSGCELKAKFG